MPFQQKHCSGQLTSALHPHAVYNVLLCYTYINFLYQRCQTHIIICMCQHLVGKFFIFCFAPINIVLYSFSLSCSLHTLCKYFNEFFPCCCHCCFLYWYMYSYQIYIYIAFPILLRTFSCTYCFYYFRHFSLKY